MKRIIPLFACLTLSGCGWTALELQQATNPMGDNVPTLLSAQIYHNLIEKSQNVDALPAAIVVGSGTAQISNQLILPSATANLTDTVFRSFGLQNQNQWAQSWSIAAVTDPGDLQRLDALYRYARARNQDDSSLCEFVISYSKAVIAAPAQSAVRLWDVVDDATRRDDYPKSGLIGLPGPPVTMPIPPESALRKCRENPHATYQQLSAANWPVPLPDRDFVRIAGNDPIPPRDAAPSPSDDTSKFVLAPGRHELKAFYVRWAAFEQFQIWIAGAPYDTISGGKSSGSSPAGSTPSKPISGAAG